MKHATKTLAALAGLILVPAAGCGSDSGGGGGGGGADCSAAQQKLPATCDMTARTCNGIAVPPDVEACNECIQTAQSLGEPQNALTTCSCNNCAAQLAACFQSATREPNGDAARDAKCRAVVDCAQSSSCAGTDCYCGVGVTLANCLTQTAPTGPCAQQIADAAGCALADAVCVATAQAAAGSALNRAYAVGVCATGDPSTMPPTAGNCH